jgi:succinoglycan biosynthesis protein ExoA
MAQFDPTPAIARNSLSEPLSLPTVTIAIPAKNEAKTIGPIIHHFLSSAYPNLIEILVADSGSTDRTAAIVQSITQTHPKVHYLKNTEGMRASGLNLMLAHATGDIFLRADAHAEYASDYIEQCVLQLLHTQAQNVGGAQRAIARTPFQAGVAIAYRSIWANGGARYRNPNYTGYVTTVYLGCFWRTDLLQICGYSTTIPSEDAELNFRLCQTKATSPEPPSTSRRMNRKFACVYMSSAIKVWYYPRKTWPTLWQQYFNYGRGRCLLAAHYTHDFQFRGKVPFLTLCAVAIAALTHACLSKLPLFLPNWFFILLVYPFLESFYLNLRWQKDFRTEIWRGNPQALPPFWVCWLLGGIAIITMPLAHGCGYGYQLWRRNILGIQQW